MLPRSAAPAAEDPKAAPPGPAFRGTTRRAPPSPRTLRAGLSSPCSRPWSPPLSCRTWPMPSPRSMTSDRSRFHPISRERHARRPRPTRGSRGIVRWPRADRRAESKVTTPMCRHPPTCFPQSKATPPIHRHRPTCFPPSKATAGIRRHRPTCFPATTVAARVSRQPHVVTTLPCPSAIADNTASRTSLRAVRASAITGIASAPSTTRCAKERPALHTACTAVPPRRALRSRFSGSDD